MPLRICILETDILRPELVDEYKGYGKMFEQLFAKQPIEAEFVTYNVVEGHYPAAGERFDAYLVTGSKADSFGDDPWIQTLRTYLLERYKAGDKLLGICFGHQLLALLLGGKTERATQGWGVGTHAYRVEKQPEWMSPALDELTLLISHQDQVTRLPRTPPSSPPASSAPMPPTPLASRCCASRGTRSSFTTTPVPCWISASRPWATRCMARASPASIATTRARQWPSG